MLSKIIKISSSSLFGFMSTYWFYAGSFFLTRKGFLFPKAIKDFSEITGAIYIVLFLFWVIISILLNRLYDKFIDDITVETSKKSNKRGLLAFFIGIIILVVYFYFSYAYEKELKKIEFEILRVVLIGLFASNILFIWKKNFGIFLNAAIEAPMRVILLITFFALLKIVYSYFFGVPHLPMYILLFSFLFFMCIFFVPNNLCNHLLFNKMIKIAMIFFVAIYVLCLTAFSYYIKTFEMENVKVGGFVGTLKMDGAGYYLDVKKILYFPIYDNETERYYYTENRPVPGWDKYVYLDKNNNVVIHHTDGNFPNVVTGRRTTLKSMLPFKQVLDFHTHLNGFSVEQIYLSDNCSNKTEYRYFNGSISEGVTVGFRDNEFFEYCQKPPLLHFINTYFTNISGYRDDGFIGYYILDGEVRGSHGLRARLLRGEKIND